MDGQGPSADLALFADLTFERRQTSAGPVELPARLFDAAVLGLVYRVPPDHAEVVVAASPLEPLVTLRRALVQLLVLEARASSLGPFSLVALTVHVRRRGTSPSKVRALVDPHGDVAQGHWALGVAVGDELLRATCVDVWGLSARCADVQTDFREAGVRAEIQGELELLIGEAGAMRTPALPIALLGTEAGLTRTTVRADHRLRWGGAASCTLRATGEGPLAQAALHLGLEGRRPSYVWRSAITRAVLPAGERLD